MRNKKKQITESLNTTQEDWDFLWEHIGDACAESDAQIRFVFGQYCNVDKEVEGLEESQFIEMTIDIIKKIFAKHKRKIGRKKKKQKESNDEPEQESEQVDESEEPEPQEEPEEDQKEQEEEILNE